MAPSGIPPVSIDWQVNITSIVVGAVVVIGHIGSFYSLKARVDSLVERLRSVEEKQDDGDRDHSSFQITIADRYVKKDDMRELEARITQRMASVEHEVRQIPMKIVSLIRPGSNA